MAIDVPGQHRDLSVEGCPHRHRGPRDQRRWRVGSRDRLTCAETHRVVSEVDLAIGRGGQGSWRADADCKRKPRRTGERHRRYDHDCEEDCGHREDRRCGPARATCSHGRSFRHSIGTGRFAVRGCHRDDRTRLQLPSSAPRGALQPRMRWPQDSARHVRCACSMRRLDLRTAASSKSRNYRGTHIKRPRTTMTLTPMGT